MRCACCAYRARVRWARFDLRQFDTLVQWQLRDVLAHVLHDAALLVVVTARAIGREPELDLRES